MQAGAFVWIDNLAKHRCGAVGCMARYCVVGLCLWRHQTVDSTPVLVVVVAVAVLEVGSLCCWFIVFGRRAASQNPSRRRRVGFSNKDGQIEMDGALAVVLAIEWIQEYLGQIQESPIKQRENPYQHYRKDSHFGIPMAESHR